MAGRSGGTNFFDYPEDADAHGPAPLTFLDGASEADWAMLIAHCERRSCASGEQVMAIGDDGRTLIIVRSGSFTVTAPTRSL